MVWLAELEPLAKLAPDCGASSWLPSALTTVRQPLQEMGRMAVSLLIRLLERHRVDALHVELATELVIRDSTGLAPLP
jgi:DNA-binding LacI/PurR family transcriptional regulator